MQDILTKILREFGRALRNLRSSPSAIVDTFFSTLYYDLFLAGKIVETSGLVPWGQKIAIFLIYPKHGVKVGHVKSLKYMISEGYSPVLVSNLPIHSQELRELIPLVSRVIVRKNYGYDFGGYRDGVRSIKYLRSRIQHLALFNDSVWFPLPDSSNWLSAAENMRVDFAGALSHAGPDWRVAIEIAQGEEKAKRKYDRLFHFCSFALLFSNNALKSDAFWKFWDRLKISSSKERTVKRGERGLSNFMLKQGFSHAVSVTNHDIAYKLRQVPPFSRSPEVNRFEKDGGWPAYSLGEFLYKEFNFMFLKKKDADGNLKARAEFLEEALNSLNCHIAIIEKEAPKFDSLNVDFEHRSVR